MIAKTLIIQKGEVRVSGEMPPEKAGPMDHQEFHKEYREDLDTFIKKSVVVGNMEEVWAYLEPWHLPQDIDGFYPLPEGITYEVKGGNNGFLSCCRVDDCYCDKRRAILTFAPKDKSNNNGMINNTGVNINSFIPPPLINTTGSNNDYMNILHESFVTPVAQEKSAEEVKPYFDYEALAKQLHGRIRSTDQEYIICAANYYADGKKHEHQPKNINSGFVICGRRHHNIFMTVGLLLDGEQERITDLNKFCEQGFVTSKDRFVERDEAGEIAFKAGQTTELKKCLFSEDLY